MHLPSLLSLTALTAIPTILALAGLIAWQRSSQLGQWIRALGPKSHLKKKGTPSMGGVALIIGQTLALIGNLGWTPLIQTYCFALWGAGLLGVVDDLFKIFQINSGISMRTKMLGLSALTLLQFGFSWQWGSTLLPGYGLIALPGIALLVLHLLCYTGCSNAVNLTDGLDGLVSGVLISFWVITLFLCEQLTPLALSWGWPVGQIVPLCWVNIISLSSFLIFNAHPAFIFMGDSGSLALGASTAALFCTLQSPLLLIVWLSVPVIEALSVMLQVGSFKLYQVRIFKMAPLHHHFELCGYSEKIVVGAFTAFNAAVGFASLFLLSESYWAQIG